MRTILVPYRYMICMRSLSTTDITGIHRYPPSTGIISSPLSHGSCVQIDGKPLAQSLPIPPPNPPFSSLLHVQIDGKPLAQSPAIERYAAKLAGLIPEDP